MLLGYRFSDKVQFFSEIEFEHANVIEVEQAFINYNLANNFNLRAGLMIVPMGIINLYHEPTTFNGVDRPGIDQNLVPSTVSYTHLRAHETVLDLVCRLL